MRVSNAAGPLSLPPRCCLLRLTPALVNLWLVSPARSVSFDSCQLLDRRWPQSIWYRAIEARRSGTTSVLTRDTFAHRFPKAPALLSESRGTYTESLVYCGLSSPATGADGRESIDGLSRPTPLELPLTQRLAATTLALRPLRGTRAPGRPRSLAALSGWVESPPPGSGILPARRDAADALSLVSLRVVVIRPPGSAGLRLRLRLGTKWRASLSGEAP